MFFFIPPPKNVSDSSIKKPNNSVEYNEPNNNKIVSTINKSSQTPAAGPTGYETTTSYIRGGIPIQRITAIKPSNLSSINKNSFSNAQTQTQQHCISPMNQNKNNSDNIQSRRIYYERDQIIPTCSKQIIKCHQDSNHDLFSNESSDSKHILKTPDVNNHQGVYRCPQKISKTILRHSINSTDSFQILHHNPISSSTLHTKNSNCIAHIQEQIKHISYPLDWLASANSLLQQQQELNREPSLYSNFHQDDVLHRKREQEQHQHHTNYFSNAEVYDSQSQEDEYLNLSLLLPPNPNISLEKSAQILSWIPESTEEPETVEIEDKVSSKTFVLKNEPKNNNVSQSEVVQEDSSLSNYLDPLIYRSIPSYRLHPDLSKTEEFWDTSLPPSTPKRTPKLVVSKCKNPLCKFKLMKARITNRGLGTPKKNFVEKPKVNNVAMYNFPSDVSLAGSFPPSANVDDDLEGNNRNENISCNCKPEPPEQNNANFKYLPTYNPKSMQNQYNRRLSSTSAYFPLLPTMSTLRATAKVKQDPCVLVEKNADASTNTHFVHYHCNYPEFISLNEPFIDSNHNINEICDKSYHPNQNVDEFYEEVPKESTKKVDIICEEEFDHNHNGEEIYEEAQTSAHDETFEASQPDTIEENSSKSENSWKTLSEPEPEEYEDYKTACLRKFLKPYESISNQKDKVKYDYVDAINFMKNFKSKATAKQIPYRIKRKESDGVLNNNVDFDSQDAGQFHSELGQVENESFLNLNDPENSTNETNVDLSFGRRLLEITNMYKQPYSRPASKDNDNICLDFYDSECVGVQRVTRSADEIQIGHNNADKPLNVEKISKIYYESGMEMEHYGNYMRRLQFLERLQEERNKQKLTDAISKQASLEEARQVDIDNNNNNNNDTTGVRKNESLKIPKKKSTKLKKRGCKKVNPKPCSEVIPNDNNHTFPKVPVIPAVLELQQERKPPAESEKAKLNSNKVKNPANNEPAQIPSSSKQIVKITQKDSLVKNNNGLAKSQSVPKSFVKTVEIVRKPEIVKVLKKQNVESKIREDTFITQPTVKSNEPLTTNVTTNIDDKQDSSKPKPPEVSSKHQVNLTMTQKVSKGEVKRTQNAKSVITDTLVIELSRKPIASSLPPNELLKLINPESTAPQPSQQQQSSFKTTQIKSNINKKKKLTKTKKYYSSSASESSKQPLLGEQRPSEEAAGLKSELEQAPKKMPKKRAEHKKDLIKVVKEKDQPKAKN